MNLYVSWHSCTGGAGPAPAGEARCAEQPATWHLCYWTFAAWSVCTRIVCCPLSTELFLSVLGQLQAQVGQELLQLARRALLSSLQPGTSQGAQLAGLHSFLQLPGLLQPWKRCAAWEASKSRAEPLENPQLQVCPSVGQQQHSLISQTRPCCARRCTGDASTAAPAWGMCRLVSAGCMYAGLCRGQRHQHTHCSSPCHPSRSERESCFTAVWVQNAQVQAVLQAPILRRAPQRCQAASLAIST